MTTFDKREDGFEKKFAVDEELKFKAVARRNKLLGQLIAEKLGMSGEAATAYAKEVVAAVFEGDGDVLRKVLGDIRPRASKYPRTGSAQQDGRTDGTGRRRGESGNVRGR